MSTKRITVLARNDHREAMRVAAGITIFEHEVSLVFMSRTVSDEDAESEEAQLLDIVDINPSTTRAELQEHLTLLTARELSALLNQSSFVVSV